MKQKTITTSKATILVVEIPKDRHWSDEKMVKAFIGSQEYIHEKLNKRIKLTLIVAYPSVAEDLASVIVEETLMHQKHGSKVYKYRAYSNGFVGFKTALESLDSLLEANEIYFDNIICKDEPVFNEEEFGNSMFAHKLFRGKHAAWQEAQSKVFDKERTYLFIKQ